LQSEKVALANDTAVHYGVFTQSSKRPANFLQM